MKLRFWKMSGAGNDFVLIEGPLKKAPAALARRLCDRRRGVGADGLLIVERRGKRARYFNADGTAAFCGNGSRCAAFWMSDKGWCGEAREFDFSTSEGLLRARLAGPGRAAVTMPSPRLLRRALKLTAAGRSWSVQFWDTGVPHAVVWVKDIEKAPVLEAGRELRFHKAFGPGGANVDFMSRRGAGLAVRTYERGVEDETLACGTGAVACAAAAHALGWAAPPVKILTRGGDLLAVSFAEDGGALSDAWLEGPAKVSFTGELKL